MSKEVKACYQNFKDHCYNYEVVGLSRPKKKKKSDEQLADFSVKGIGCNQLHCPCCKLAMVDMMISMLQF